MIRHHEKLLWSYAARELDAGESKVLEHHLAECPECTEKLEAVVLAREALLLAHQSKPVVEWAKVDRAVNAVIDLRLRAKVARRWRFTALATALAMAAVVLWYAVPDRAAPQPAPLVTIAQAPLEESRVERARNLSLSGSKAQAGAAIEAGAVLQTGSGGESIALVHLADQSHVRLASSSVLSLSRAAATEVKMRLEKGRVVIHASHHPRSAFIVQSGDLEVHVLGTTFSVSKSGPVTEVSVLEGKVRVEAAAGDSTVVEAGERAVFRGRSVQRSVLTVTARRELDELHAVTDEAKPELNPVPAATVMGGRLPRLAPKVAQARQVVLAQAAPSAPEVLVEPVLQPAPAPELEVVSPQAQTAQKPISQDLESLFLQRAEAALAKGTCEGFMLGLEDIASDAQLSEHTERARILRARCFEVGLRPRQAMAEYRKYLEAYAGGRFVQEARKATGQ